MKRKIVQSDSEGEDVEGQGGEPDHDETEVRRSQRPRASRIPKSAPKRSALEILADIENEDEDDVGVWKEETEEERRRRVNFVVDDDGTGYIDDDVDHERREYAVSDAEDDEVAEGTESGDKKKKRKNKKLGDVDARAEIQKTTIMDMFAKSAARRNKAIDEQAHVAVDLKEEDIRMSVDDGLADLLVSSVKSSNRPRASGPVSRPPLRPAVNTYSRQGPVSRPRHISSSQSRPRSEPQDMKSSQGVRNVTVEAPSLNSFEDGPDFHDSGPSDEAAEEDNVDSTKDEHRDAPVATFQEEISAAPMEVSVEAPKPVLSNRSKLLALASTAPLPGTKPKEEISTVRVSQAMPVPPTTARPSIALPLALVEGRSDLPMMAAPTGFFSEPTSSINSQVFPSTPLADKPDKETIELYWLDMWEDRNLPGEVFVFGRTHNPDSTTTSSALVVLQNVSRCLLFLPRGDGASDESGRKAVQDEALDAIRNRLDPAKRDHVRFRSKWVTLSYAFELPDIPRCKAEYLMVQYSMSLEMRSAAFEPFPSGRTFAHVFGANQSAIERLILSNKLMGPCWLSVTSSGIAKDKTGKSHTKYEAVVNLETSGTVITIVQKPVPSVSVLSLALKTIVDPVSHAHQIVAATGILHPEVSLDASKPATSKDAVIAFQLVRPVNSDILPAGFSTQNPSVQCQPNERALLSLLLAKLHLIDPDFLMGHNIEGFELDLLLTRTKFYKIGQWSKLGRLHLREQPKAKKLAGGRSTHYGVLTPGRLLLDTYKCAQEFVLGQREYSLTSLCDNLGLTPPGCRRIDLDPSSVPEYFKTRESLAGLMRHTVETAQLALELAFKLEAFSLSFELTTIAGNLWRRTLGAGRAERIEYLLLHSFHNMDYIVPDKEDFSAEKKRKNQNASKKAGYLGGLVLEPKAGLYDSFVVLLDFNALYPSIIQEYNICFTTVSRPPVRDEDGEGESSKKKIKGDVEGGEEEEDENMEVEHGEDDDGQAAAAAAADDEVPLPEDNGRGPNGLAVLPRVIKSIVDRRVQVKNQLAVEGDVMKRRQLDTRQKALKITANSMYGCLGFSSSRFFAKPIASLITSRGRLILQDTVETTKQLGYDVVYGDTDSIMIDTRQRAESPQLTPKDLEPVYKIASDIQGAVNPKYKYLKIALDGMFGTLLLLKKKKYAALSLHVTKDSVITKRETKGLDLVRRDWCLASRDIGSQVLDLILSGKAKDDVVEGIRAALLHFNEEAKAGRIGLGKWTVTKGLNKSPRDYPDAKGQPHLQVALAMMTNGKVVNTGDHIPYIICTKTRAEIKAEEEAKVNNADPAIVSPPVPSGSSKTSFADRAYHPDEVRELGLSVDLDWYLVTQILPPVQRLCEGIDGVSTGELAEALGLDAAKYRSSMPTVQINTISSRFDEVFGNSFAADIERFANCEKLEVDCPSCSLHFALPGVFWLPEEKKSILGVSQVDSLELTPGNCCPKCSHEVLDGVVLQNMLVLSARKAIRKFYQGWLISDDPTATDLLTRQQGLRGEYVFNGKRVKLNRKFSGADLWVQLMYLASLVDWKRAGSSLIKENEQRKKSGLSPLMIVHSHDQVEALEDAKKFFDGAFVHHSRRAWLPQDFFSKVFRTAV